MLEGREVKMTDHAFSVFLKRRGWKGQVHKCANLSEFVDDEGHLIAKVIYNNAESTHRIFIFQREAYKAINKALGK